MCSDNKKAFTLIELLVVIAIIAVLMSILMPTLQRVRRQTKSVVCQSNLKQWGSYWAITVAEYNGLFPHPDPSDKEAWEHWRGYWYGWGGYGWGGWGWGPYWGWGYSSYYDGSYRHRDQPLKDYTRGIRCCPMAARPYDRTDDRAYGQGGTFLAWGASSGKTVNTYHDIFGSYGSNPWAGFPHPDMEPRDRDIFWKTPDVRGANYIPLQMDSAYPGSAIGSSYNPPPQCDAIPDARVQEYWGGGCCINRHDAFINSVFMDFSVRKVGLKELWTLKWHRDYDTAGPWTKAGKVKPEDWPQWMRSFKDY